jgi:drug/metabolite transporter (DMT)-like permease
MLLGILLGFGAAAGLSTSYICSRVFTHKYSGRTLSLLSLSHIAMGVFSLILLPFVWPVRMPQFAQYAVSLIACSGFYLIGQVFLFITLRTANASRVSPLLGLKVFILALIGVFFLNQHFGLLQWVAIALSVAAASMLSQTGEKLSKRSMLWILLTCVSYSVSDINIKILVSHFEYLGLLHASVLSTSLAYITCGIFALVLFLFLPRPTPAMWAYSMPFAGAWFFSMLLLFPCFASIGVVFGNIVQSTRGIISIFLGVVLAAYNLDHLEQKVSRGVFFQRLVAAILMSCAIALYYLGA